MPQDIAAGDWRSRDAGKHYRELAHWLRGIAAKCRFPGTQRELLSLARRYDARADDLSRRAAASSSARLDVTGAARIGDADKCRRERRTWGDQFGEAAKRCSPTETLFNRNPRPATGQSPKQPRLRRC